MGPRMRMWEGLSTAKAGGWACVVCGQDYLRERRGPTRRVPVGRVMSTGSVVFACVGVCVERAVVRCYRGGAMALSGEALSVATARFHRAVLGRRDPYPGLAGDPLGAGEVVCEVVAAAAPLVIAAELRWLAGVFDDLAQAVWARVADTVGAVAGTDPVEQRYEALLECAHLARRHALGMDPAGGAS